MRKNNNTKADRTYAALVTMLTSQTQVLACSVALLTDDRMARRLHSASHSSMLWLVSTIPRPGNDDKTKRTRTGGILRPRVCKKHDHGASFMPQNKKHQRTAAKKKPGNRNAIED